MYYAPTEIVIDPVLYFTYMTVSVTAVITSPLDDEARENDEQQALAGRESEGHSRATLDFLLVS